MSKIQIEIDTDDLLPSYEYDPETGPSGEPGAPLESLVIDAAARQIIRDEDFDKRVRREVEKRIQETVSEQVDASLRAVVEDIIAAPIQRRHPWGDKNGEETTVREIVRERVEKFFTNTGTGRSDLYGSQGKEVGIGQLVQNLTRDALDKELSDEVRAARAEVRDAIRDKALRAAVDAITPRA